MAKKHYVYSTLSADQEYTAYREGGADLPITAGSVFIKGGANVADKRLHTPYGVVTEVDGDQLAALESNHVFQLHKANGFIRVSDKREDPEVVAADMEGRSPDAPLVDGDFDPNAPGAKPTNLAPDANAPAGAATQKTAAPAHNPRKA